MLTNYQAIASIPATDLPRAKKWYADKLGFEPTEEDSESVFYEAAGGTRFALFPTREQPGAGHTVLSFEVDNVEKVVEDLQGRGVSFEEYDYPDLKTTNGIATLPGYKGAWFKDSEGNILAVGQRTK